jgi:hypothetical protein
MSRLSVTVDQEHLEELRRVAAERGKPAATLIREYIAYLVAGGTAITEQHERISSLEIAELARAGGSFDWLCAEPDLYSLADGEPV